MQLHVVFYQEEGDWYAHCLEFDLVEAGTDIPTAKGNIIDVIRAHILWAAQNDNMEHLYRSAPIEYWKRLRQGQPLGTERIRIDVPGDDDSVIPPAWMLEEVQFNHAST
jgi:hypothetical protein